MTIESNLNAQELWIVKQLANGGCGKEVAGRLKMNRNTLNNILFRIRSKTKCVNTTHLVYKLSKENII